MPPKNNKMTKNLIHFLIKCLINKLINIEMIIKNNAPNRGELINLNIIMKYLIKIINNIKYDL